MLKANEIQTSRVNNNKIDIKRSENDNKMETLKSIQQVKNLFGQFGECFPLQYCNCSKNSLSTIATHLGICCPCLVTTLASKNSAEW